MKAGLVAIGFNVVSPAHFSGLRVKRVENAGTGAEKESVPCDRRGRKISTVGVEMPESASMGSGAGQRNCKEHKRGRSERRQRREKNASDLRAQARHG